jgi:hypothetical protein
MQITLTQEEMLNRWRLYRAMEPLRSDCTAERSDGIDLDSILTMQMRAWYLDLLDCGDPRHVARTDVKERTTVTNMGDGSGLLTLPDDCRRLLALRMDGWERDARIVEPNSPLALAQLNPFTCGTRWAPVAIVDRQRCRIYPLPTSATIKWAYGAVAPTDGSYTMNDSALSLITPQI